MKLTAVFLKVPEGYIGFVEELPGANTQGKTLQEARDNIREAIEMTLEANRTLAEESLATANENHGGRQAVGVDRSRFPQRADQA